VLIAYVNVAKWNWWFYGVYRGNIEEAKEIAI
jgi:hypothetical protein